MSIGAGFNLGKNEETAYGEEPLKIIIIDDDKSTIMLLEHILGKSNKEYLIYTAGNGAAALSVIKNNQFDIAFIDIWLPDMNGLEILDRIKKINPHTLCYVISSQSDNSYINKAMKLGIEQYILKPFKDEQILGALAALDNTNRVATEK